MSITITSPETGTITLTPPVSLTVEAATNGDGGGGTGYAFRGIYCRDSEFAACYPDPFHDMNLSAMECYIYSGTTNLKARMDSLIAPDMGWSIIGSFAPSTSGGSFSVNDANCRTIVKSIKDHLRNSHFYYIADEPDISHLAGSSPWQPTWTKSQQDANRNKLKARCDLIHEEDPKAVVWIGEYRQHQLSQAPVNTSNGYEGGCGRPGGMWKGIVDGVMLSGYPSPNVDQEPDRIPNQAKWCDEAGIRYIGIRSCHDYQTDNPAYPTQTQYAKADAQWKETNEEGSMLYIWYDADGTKHLSADPTMQQFIGTLV